MKYRKILKSFRLTEEEFNKLESLIEDSNHDTFSELIRDMLFNTAQSHDK